MKTATFTDEQIIEAGMSLLANDRRVTPFGIRKLIGGGNPNRIKTVWVKSQEGVIDSHVIAKHIEIPSEFSDSLEATKSGLDELAKGLYLRAQEIAESRVRESIAAGRTAKERAESEIAEAMATVVELDQDSEIMKKRLFEMADDLQKQKDDMTRLQERFELLVESEGQLKTDNADKTAQIKVLEKENITLDVRSKLVDEQFKASRDGEEKAKEELAVVKAKLVILEEKD